MEGTPPTMSTTPDDSTTPERWRREVRVSAPSEPDPPIPTTPPSSPVEVRQTEEVTTPARLTPRAEVLQRRRYTVGKLIDVVWYLIGLLEVLLALRFLFEITGANRSAGFLQFLDAVTGPFVWPFEGIFGVPGRGAYVFDPNLLVAMVIYALLGLGLTRLLALSVESPSVA
jgi:hypothetical protein